MQRYFLRRSSTRALAVFDSPPLARGRLSAATSSTFGELPVTVLTASDISRLTAWLRALSLKIAASLDGGDLGMRAATGAALLPPHAREVAAAIADHGRAIGGKP